jgi:putative transposase
VIELSRNPRKKSQSGIYHIILRGINKQTIFEDDEDRQRFLSTILKYKKTSNFQVYGYCLMSNHIHLLLRETKEMLSESLKRISSSYVYWYNNKYERCGHLFQDRYKSEPVENDSYFLTVLRYIHQNPIKASITNSMEGYRWSSYGEYLKHSIIADTDFALQMYSENRQMSIKYFKEHTQEINEDQCLEYKEKKKLTDTEIRDEMLKLGLSSGGELQRLEKDKRNALIKVLKSFEGISMRQLSRITGISKSVIDRI